MRRSWSSAAVGLLAATLVVATAAPASAEHWSRTDRVGDGFAGGDIRRLTAVNGDGGEDGLMVNVRVARLDGHQIKRAVLMIDTNRRDGTDYMVISRRTGQGRQLVLKRAELFSDDPGVRVPCRVMHTKWSPREDKIWIRIPRSCLSAPSETLRVGYTTESGHDSDWAPGAHGTFGRWLTTGPGQARSRG